MAELSGEDAFRIASFELVEDPQAPKPLTIFGMPVVIDPTVPRSIGGYLVSSQRWRLRARGDFDGAFALTNGRIEDILHNPGDYAPGNPYYQKNHVSAPGTVRQWFRQMRAADFQRDVELVAVDLGRDTFFKMRPSRSGDWTLFNTQTVIDLETAAHYPDIQFRRDCVWLEVDALADSIFGRSPLVDWFGTPALLCGLAETTGPWLGFDRSTCQEPLAGLSLETIRKPIFHGQLPAPGEGRGITLEDVKRFVREDDARRSERRGP